jgi:hypothetical protein
VTPVDNYEQAKERTVKNRAIVQINPFKLLSLMTSSTALIGAGVAGAVGFGLYVFGYIFHAGSTPGKNAAQDKFIGDTCNPKEGILVTVLTWGYTKATWRRFRVDFAAWFWREPKAKLGHLAPDAALVDLDGKELSLLADFVNKMPKGMPLVLNMGSMT